MAKKLSDVGNINIVMQKMGRRGVPKAIDRQVFLQLKPFLDRFHDGLINAFAVKWIAEPGEEQISRIITGSPQQYLATCFQVFFDIKVCVLADWYKPGDIPFALLD